MNWLEGYVALVTGGGSGIGRAVVARYLNEGAKGIGVLVRQEAQARSLQAEFGERVTVTIGDARSAGDNARAVDATLSAYGKLDTLVGNAGIWDFCTRLEKMTLDKVSEAFDELFSVNVKGYLLAARAAASALRESRGSMIFTLSNASFYAGGGGPLYVASKHACVGLIRQLAFEFAPDVRVNGVAPGGTVTPLRGPSSLGKDQRRLSEIPGFEESEAAHMPLGFAAQPEDHTGHFVLLASKHNSPATTATIIHSDGGWEIRHAY
jgi:NAD(P)-dependent dehydrogenase (short-subunit alcohol dehydrogenase family)